MDYLIHITIMIAIYTMLSQSLSLLAGYARMLSLAHAGYYGMGAYTAAILSTQYSIPFLPSLVIAIFFCGLVSFVISFISLRTVDDYYIICTLGVQIIISSIFCNWTSLTNGPMGIPNIPDLTIFGIIIKEKISYLILIFIFAVLLYLLIRQIVRSSFGRLLICFSEDEIYGISMGKNVYQIKVLASTLSAMLAAIPGVFFAYYINFIDPSSFTFNESIFILTIVILGGERSLKGIFFATIFLVTLPEILRLIGLPTAIAANFRQILYGSILIFSMFNVNSHYKNKFKLGG